MGVQGESGERKGMIGENNKREQTGVNEVQCSCK